MIPILVMLPAMTEGAAKVAGIDPHGWTLTLISVSVVFAALIVLYFIYNLSGKAFSGELKKAVRKPKGGDAEIAAAIAYALSAESADDTVAAIAIALELESGACVHDIEPGIITIRHEVSPWDDKSANFRKRI